jgi:hypothetical protein
MTRRGEAQKRSPEKKPRKEVQKDELDHLVEKRRLAAPEAV